MITQSTNEKLGNSLDKRRLTFFRSSNTTIADLDMRMKIVSECFLDIFSGRQRYILR
jgi:hypothetical protein